MALLLLDVLSENRRKGRFLLHESLIPNHFHLLLTPAEEIPLEKALQFIKAGVSENGVGLKDSSLFTRQHIIPPGNSSS